MNNFEKHEVLNQIGVDRYKDFWVYPFVEVATKWLLLLAEVEGFFVRIEDNNVLHQSPRPFTISEVTDE